MSEGPDTTVIVRPGRPDEAAALSALALRSKAHWGYDAGFLARCRAELTLSPDDVPARRTTVAQVDGRIIGFVTVDGSPPDGEIGALFVEPDAIGTGTGRVLWRAALVVARAAGFAQLTIDADPGAEGFYLRMGAGRCGETPSGSVPGRVLPRLVFDVGEAKAHQRR